MALPRALRGKLRSFRVSGFAFFSGWHLVDFLSTSWPTWTGIWPHAVHGRFKNHWFGGRANPSGEARPRAQRFRVSGFRV